MEYRIISDSCLDLTPRMKEEGKIQIVPLTLRVDDKDYIDDETFDQAEFLKAVAEYEGCPKSSCPSPEAYRNAFGEDDVPVFCITLSSELSGSYNSALLAERMLEEDFPNKKVHVFNSRSASAGQTLLGYMIQELAESGMTFEQIVHDVELFISFQNTMFVLDNLDTLRKNGRLTGLKAAVVNVLNIKPIMASTPEGSIQQAGMGRGTKKALKKMVEEIGKKTDSTDGKMIAISFCNCPERAKYVRSEIEKAYNFKKIIVAETCGVSTMYANDGGIVISF